MTNVSSSGLLRARWSWLLLPLLATACGAGPDAANPAPLEAAAASDPALRPLTCASPPDSFPVVKASGALAGQALDHLTLTLLASGGVLADAPTPFAAPGLDGGSWTARYGFQPWSLTAGLAGAYYLLLPPVLGEAFSAYYLTVSSAGAHVLHRLSCSAPWPAAPRAPAAGPPGPAVQGFACESGLVRSTVAVTVSGGLDASGLPRDVRVTRLASGAVEALAAAPAYLPAFDGGAWTASALYAWALDGSPEVSHVLLLPLSPAGAFEAVAITDLGAAGRIEVPLTCTAG